MGNTTSSLYNQSGIPWNTYAHNRFWFSKGMIVLAVFSGYFVSSLFLLKFPLLYKKKRQAFQCSHISHRGGAGENLENTMTAFRHAWGNTKTDMLELDCHLSKDGEVIVAHDGLLLRTAGSTHRISDTNYVDLPLMKESLTLDFGKKYYCKAQNGDRKMPLLREVFEEFPNVAINVDIKENNDELVSKVSELIKEFKREHLTVWGNFRDTVTQKCYRVNPNVPLLFSIRRTLMTLVLFYTGLLPFFPIKEQFFEICMPSIFLSGETNFVIARRFHRATVWVFDKMLMRKALFDHLKKRGIQVYIWVLNSESEFERAFNLGATGVMTDFPTRLRQFLDDNPQYHRSIYWIKFEKMKELTAGDKISIEDICGTNNFIANLPFDQSVIIRKLPQKISELLAFNQRIIFELIKSEETKKSCTPTNLQLNRQKTIEKMRQCGHSLERNLTTEKATIENLLSRLQQETQRQTALEQQVVTERRRYQALEAQRIQLQNSQPSGCKTSLSENANRAKKYSTKHCFGSRIERFEKRIL